MAIPTNFTGDSGEDLPEDRPFPEEPVHQQRARARTKLQVAYREHLGREMTDADFDGWWSGRSGPKGGPPGIEGLDGWLRSIKQEGDRLQSAVPASTDGTGVPTRTGQAPPGWDQRKWADPEHHTVKYDAAAFLSGLTKPSEIAAMVQSDEFQKRFSGATFNNKDKIDFGNKVGVIDVLMRADQGADTSGGLWWGADGGDDTTAASTVAGPRQDVPVPDVPVPDVPPWTQPPGSPLFNPPATQGPPSMGYGMGPGGGGGTMGQMITPYNPLATYSPTPYITPAPFRPPAYEGATPFEREPYAAAVPFTGPTAEDITSDPGYQFRVQQGREALERSGAALGVTNTGGTMKDLFDYGSRSASQELQNAFGRQRDVYDLNERNRFNAYQANWGNAMDAYNVNERNRAGAFATNIGTARDAYAMNVENRYQGYATNELARWQENQEAEARRSGAYGANLGAYERQQQYGLRAQGQASDQAYRNWVEEWGQGRQNAQDTYNRMYGLATT